MRRLAQICAWLVCLAGIACGRSRGELLAFLESDQPELRAQAVRELAQRAVSDDLILFTHAAHDPSALVRAETTQALAKLRTKGAIDLLGELLSDGDTRVQLRAAEALSRFEGDRRAQAYLVSRFQRATRDARAAIADAMTKSGVKDSARTLVRAEAEAIWETHARALRIGTAAERAAAAEEIGRSGRKEAVALLAPLLEDRQVLLTAAAARGLGHTGDPAVLQLLGPLLEAPEPELRLAAAEGLVEAGGEGAAAIVLAAVAARGELDEGVQAAVQTLPHTEPVRTLLCTAIERMSGLSADALAKIAAARGGCDAAPYVALLSRGPKLTSPQTAERALSRLACAHAQSAPAASDAAVSFLRASEPTVRAWAARALASLGKARRPDEVERALDEALRALAARGEDWVKQPLPLVANPKFDLSPISKEYEEISRAGESPDEDAQKSTKLGVLLERVAKRGRVRGPQRRPEIVADFSESEAEYVAVLLRGLSRIAPAAAFARAQPFLTSGSRTLRQAALVAAAHAGAEGQSAAREAVLGDDDALRTEVAAAWMASGPFGRSALIDVLRQRPAHALPLLSALEGAALSIDEAAVVMPWLLGTAVESAVAARLLKGRLSDQTLPALKQAWRSAAAARRELILALGESGDNAAMDLVAQELWHESPEVRAAAAHIVAKTGGAGGAAIVSALGHDYYRVVREAAVRGGSR
ncbi:MAG: HEAT repeat domain-containing protein [Myxococcaceae bacterium]